MDPHRSEAETLATVGPLSAEPVSSRVRSDSTRGEATEERLRRALADLENMRKRYAEQLATEQASERARVSTAWLPVLDNLELALEHAGNSRESIVEGVRAVRDQAVALLAAYGYQRHDETGVPFDPLRHEAVGVVPGASVPGGTIVRVLRAGYGDGERLLRPASVVVAGEPVSSDEA
jgi:molecular chaperone GrpE